MLLFTSLLIKIDEQKEIHSAESHGAFIRIHSFRIPICFRAFINQAIIMMAAQNLLGSLWPFVRFGRRNWNEN